MYSFLYLSFSINIVFSYVDLSSTIMYIVFVDFNKSSFQKKKKKQQKETLMATYKAVMRPALEYASSVWSPIASSTSINKLQVINNLS